MKLCTGIVMAVAPDRRPLGEVDFFGYKGLDVAAVRAALPFHEGDSFPPAKVHSDQLKRKVAEAIERAIGREPTDVSFVCCDAKQNYMVYVGLPGESYEALAFAPAPTGYLHLGHVLNAQYVWALARQQGARVLLRIARNTAPLLRSIPTKP